MNAHISEGEDPTVTLTMTLDQASRVHALLGWTSIGSSPIVNGTTTFLDLDEVLKGREDVPTFSIEDSWGNPVNVINLVRVD